MPKLRIAVLVMVVLALLSICFALKRPSPTITLHKLRISKVADTLGVSIQATNHTLRLYAIVPVRLEIRDDLGWKEYPGVIAGLGLGTQVEPHNTAWAGCILQRASTGARLRLVFVAEKGRRGLETFLLRVRLRLSGDPSQSLNPFDKRIIACAESFVVSEDFVQP
jgi:hypothetical protein